jgi:hypothetical protein
MAASSKLMVSEAERRFPVRLRIALPAGGFGTRLTTIHEWLDQNAGADGWAITPSGVRGIVNDAVAVYFADATIAAGVRGALVWWSQSRVTRRLVQCTKR